MPSLRQRHLRKRQRVRIRPIQQCFSIFLPNISIGSRSRYRYRDLENDFISQCGLHVFRDLNDLWHIPNLQCLCLAGDCPNSILHHTAIATLIRRFYLAQNQTRPHLPQQVHPIFLPLIQQGPRPRRHHLKLRLLTRPHRERLRLLLDLHRYRLPPHPHQPLTREIALIPVNPRWQNQRIFVCQNDLPSAHRHHLKHRSCLRHKVSLQHHSHPRSRLHLHISRHPQGCETLLSQPQHNLRRVSNRQPTFQTQHLPPDRC